MLFQFEGRILLSYKNKDRVNFNYLSRCISIFLIFFAKGLQWGKRRFSGKKCKRFSLFCGFIRKFAGNNEMGI